MREKDIERECANHLPNLRRRWRVRWWYAKLTIRMAERIHLTHTIHHYLVLQKMVPTLMHTSRTTSGALL